MSDLKDLEEEQEEEKRQESEEEIGEEAEEEETGDKEWSGEVIKLHKQGVCPKVLNYMLKTGIRAKEERAAISGASRRWWWYNRQWYFGPPFGPWIGPGPYWRY